MEIYRVSKITSLLKRDIDLLQTDPVTHTHTTVCDTQTQWSPLPPKKKKCHREKKVNKPCLNADCNNLHFIFTSVCDMINRFYYCFLISQSKKCLPFHLTLMWQTVWFTISATAIKCLFWCKLGGARLAAEQENKRRMSREERWAFMNSVYLNKFTLDKTLIIIIIIIWKGHPICDDLEVLQFGLICLAKKYFVRGLAAVMGFFLCVSLHN